MLPLSIHVEKWVGAPLQHLMSRHPVLLRVLSARTKRLCALLRSRGKRLATRVRYDVCSVIRDGSGRRIGGTVTEEGGVCAETLPVGVRSKWLTKRGEEGGGVKREGFLLWYVGRVVAAGRNRMDGSMISRDRKETPCRCCVCAKIVWADG